MVQMGVVDEKWAISDRNPEVDSWDALNEEQKKNMDLLMSIYAAQIDRC